MDGSRSGSAGQRETRGSNRGSVEARGAIVERGRSIARARALPETSFCPPRCRRDVRVYFVRLSIRAAAQGGPPRARSLLGVLYTPGDQLTGAEGKKGNAFEGGRHRYRATLDPPRRGRKSRAAKSEFEDRLLEVSRSLLLGRAVEESGGERKGEREELVGSKV